MVDAEHSRVVLFTNESALSRELFSYIYAQVAACAPEACVLAVRSSQQPIRRRLARGWRKIRKLGPGPALEIVTSNWIRHALMRRENDDLEERLARLHRPSCQLDPQDIRWVSSSNGEDAVHALKALNPAILVQAGVGILRPQIFQVPKLGTLNLHHGIAPLIRGMESIYWGLWERRPEWIGATVHFIDKGIDTGQTLAYFRVDPIEAGEGFASLFSRATEGGVLQLTKVIGRLLAGEPVGVAPAMGKSEYRSTFSGWKMLLLSERLRRARKDRMKTRSNP